MTLAQARVNTARDRVFVDVLRGKGDIPFPSIHTTLTLAEARMLRDELNACDLP